MTILAVHDIAADAEVFVTREMPALPAALDARLDQHWTAAQQTSGSRLFNGRVFSVDQITPTRLSGHFTEYRRLVAQIAEPALFGALGVRSLSVCGAVRCADGIVLGRRDRRAAYEAGMWQLPPAGSVDSSAPTTDGRIDVRRHFLRELEEELGWTAAEIASVTPLCMVEHAGSHVLDLGFAATLPADTASVLARHRLARDAAEYDPLIVMPWATLAAQVAELGSRLVPTGRIFLQQLGLISDNRQC